MEVEVKGGVELGVRGRSKGKRLDVMRDIKGTRY